MSRQVFTLESAVGSEGKIEVKVPLPTGTRVEIVILGPRDENWDEMLQAAASSMGFWDNPLDDEVWNNA